MQIKEKITQKIPLIEIDGRSIWDARVNKKDVAIMAAVLVIMECVVYFAVKVWGIL
jgi:hypothetical protein